MTLKCTVLFAAGFLALAAPAAAQSDGLEKFAARAAESAETVDYSAFDKYLSAFSVPDEERLKFRFSASRNEGTAFLRRYVGALADISPATLNGDEQLAYWLNLRNLLVLAHVSETGGRANMKKDRGLAAAPGAVWTAKTVTVDGVALSIVDIERRILMANWRDPRILYGLYQGAAGGPPALRTAFRGDKVWTQLEAAARRYLATPAGFEATKKGAQLSAVFAWYQDPFFPDEPALRAHLNKFITHAARITLEKTATIGYRDFSYKLDSYVDRVVPQRPEEQGPQRPSFPTGS